MLLKRLYDEMIKKVNTIDNNRFVKKQIVMVRSKILKTKYLILVA